jgi:hypothetical protein
MRTRDETPLFRGMPLLRRRERSAAEQEASPTRGVPGLRIRLQTLPVPFPFIREQAGRSTPS